MNLRDIRPGDALMYNDFVVVVTQVLGPDDAFNGYVVGTYEPYVAGDKVEGLFLPEELSPRA